jgi:hypothetical protein
VEGFRAACGRLDAREGTVKAIGKLIAGGIIFALLFFVLSSSIPAAEKASLPALVTSCGQSPGPVKIGVFLKRLKLEYSYVPQMTAKDLQEKKKAGTPYKSIIIVTGASLKGMGAAGVSIEDELDRTKALIAEAKKQGITIIGAHIEGMARRAQGAAEGDNSDEMSIDVVCNQAAFLLVRKDGNEDGRFTTISKSKNIPLVLYEKDMELEGLLKKIFTP